MKRKDEERVKRASDERRTDSPPLRHTPWVSVSRLEMHENGGSTLASKTLL